MLSRGSPNREIAEALGVSVSTVSRYARALGYGSPSGGRPVHYDWEAIRRLYEAGGDGPRVPGPVRVLQWRLGQRRLAQRGRAPTRCAPGMAHSRRMAVASLLDRGLSMSAVARELGISQSTVSYHARRLGIAPVESARRRSDWEAVQRAYDAGLSVAECRALFGFSPASWHAAARRDVDNIQRCQRKFLQ